MAFRVALVVLLLVLTAACGEDSDPGSPAPGEGTSMTPTVNDDRVAAAVADLASREGVDASDITVVDASPVTWSDGSLGCPKPGMSYTQALTEGFLLVLETGGKRVEYHGALRGPLKLCENPKPPVSGMQ